MKSIKIFCSTVLALLLFYYIKGFFSLFGEPTEVFGGLISFIVISVMWWRGVKRIRKQYLV